MKAVTKIKLHDSIAFALGRFYDLESLTGFIGVSYTGSLKIIFGDFIRKFTKPPAHIVRVFCATECGLQMIH
jgi:hypothetical protein